MGGSHRLFDVSDSIPSTVGATQRAENINKEKQISKNVKLVQRFRPKWCKVWTLC